MGKVYLGQIDFLKYQNARYINFLPSQQVQDYDLEVSLSDSSNIYLSHNNQVYNFTTEDDDNFYFNWNMCGFARGLFELKHTDALNKSITKFANVTNMHTAFANCYSLRGSPRCTNNVFSMYGTYYNDKKLEGNFVLGSSVNNLIGTYYNCYGLTTIEAPEGGVPAKMMIQTFYNCTNLTGPTFDVDLAQSLRDSFYNCVLLEGKPCNCNSAYITTNAYYNCPNVYGTFYWLYKNSSQADIVNITNMFYHRNYANKLNMYVRAGGSVLNALVNYSGTYGNIYGTATPIDWTLVPEEHGRYYYNNSMTNTNIYVVIDAPLIIDATVDGVCVNIKFKIPRNQDYTHIYLIGNKDGIIEEDYEDNEVYVSLKPTDKNKEIDLEYENSEYEFIIMAETIYGTVFSNTYIISTEENTYPILLSTSIAVSNFESTSTEQVWIAYIKQIDNKLRVKYSNKSSLVQWTEESIGSVSGENVIKCDIAFNARMNKISNNKSEWITDNKPYVAYVTTDGALYLLDLNTGTTELLAAENVTDVSMVRSPAINEERDYGFTVFFIAENKIYYRQLIDGIWYDGEVVASDRTYVTIEAFCSWDYRTGLQATDSDGNLYQFITYPEGLLDTREHIAFTDINATAELIWGWSAFVTDIQNTDSETIQITFNCPNTEQGLLSSMFTLVDSNGYNYICQSFTLNDTVLTLTFDDFNLAALADNLTLTYTKPSSGGLLSPAVQTNSFVETFIPTGLTPPAINPPAFASVTNSADGMEITLVLTEDMLNTDVSNMLSHFELSDQEYTYVPEGTLETTTRTMATITKIDNKTLKFTINKPSISSAIGNVTITYDGLGGLKGLGGPAAAFTGTFTPTGLTWKGHQNDVEHIEFSNIAANIILNELRNLQAKTADEHIEVSDINVTINLRALQYLDTKSSDEHIEFSNISATVVLTDIHDI